MCYLDQLEDEEVQTRVAGCAALGCLKVRGVWGGVAELVGHLFSKLGWPRGG